MRILRSSSNSIQLRPTSTNSEQADIYKTILAAVIRSALSKFRESVPHIYEVEIDIYSYNGKVAYSVERW